jgi:beta-galactosidase
MIILYQGSKNFKIQIMRFITFVICLLFCFSLSYSQKKQTQMQNNRRIEKIINSGWTFNYFPKESAPRNYEAFGFDDSKWSAISLPHTWRTYETTGELNPFIINSAEDDNMYWWTGWGWYRKHFSLNREYFGRKVFIEFEGVQKYCKVWLNGQLLGEHMKLPANCIRLL